MAFIAVFVPFFMLGVLVALGRYEELMLPRAEDEPEVREAPSPVVAGVRDTGRDA
ncbi:hypothetical protein GCM10018793_69070 [Streptomyces sulfonofaciens]|uniref:Uncharacterized protein n=1 Tax=Streptomyces sulfonofaciens TaxID=68272 RepID=A0A919L994_9ACTN|nr:hypothetical protein [Streptomyces sulfonofaciens]GHH88648.1 hypothetical protein GCM10018793_69070 [Streptomyces sulfonofaciens]